MKKRTTFTLLLIILLLALTLTACGGSQAKSAPAYYPVADELVDFYNFLGGEELLGKAISPLLEEKDGVKVQYIETCLLKYNPKATGSARYYLGELGKRTGHTDDPPKNLTVKEGDVVSDGYKIYPDFVTLFQRFGSGIYSGKPISKPYLNEDLNRMEQYFANVAFYIPLEDEGAVPAMIPLGVRACEGGCIPTPQPTSLPLVGVGDQGEISEPFASAIKVIGQDLLGAHLEGPYWAPDGQREVIFENMVLFAKKGKAMPRPITEMLGYTASPPAAPSGGLDVTFLEIENGMGYNVPQQLYDYIMAHGGLEISGMPISEATEIGRKHYQQCFTNVCLEYVETRTDTNTVLVTPLGQVYLEQVYPLMSTPSPEEETPVKEATPEKEGKQPKPKDTQVSAKPEATAPNLSDIEFTTMEAYPLLGKGQQQVILIHAVNSEGQPLAGVNFKVTITLPDRSAAW
jgi:predicted small lipoprotein YifL